VNLAFILALLFIPAWAVPANRQLHELVDSGALSGLHWPNFTRIQPDVSRFYELNDYQLAWVRSGAITPPAQALLGVLRNAALKGLDPRDYEGARWSVSEAGYERFDLALTVSAMRYISDVSAGTPMV
jgi:murein L,D-transpeptidase YcbB/YkuD